MYSLPFECGQLTSGYNFRERCSLSLSQHLRIANNSMARPGILGPILLSMMRFGLTWVCTGLVHAIPVTVSSCTQLSCCIYKILFPYRSPLPLLPILFLSPLLQWSLSLWRTARVMYVSFTTEHSGVSYFLHFIQLWASGLITIS